MKIVYMGTPEFAAVPLVKLHSIGQDIQLVVTQPDRPKDRGHKMQACPVKIKATELGLPVVTPEKVRGDQEFFEKLKSLSPDLIVVAAFGQILPKEILDLPKYGCVNIHASILPEYRGAAPIHRAVIDGKAETGVTLMYMSEKLDCGDIIDVATTPVGRKTTPELFAELAILGADLLADNLEKFENGSIKRVPQDDSKATYAKMVFKEDGRIDFTKSAVQIDCLVRGLYGGPSAWTLYNGEAMKIHRASPLSESCSAAPGTIIAADKKGIKVSCGGGVLLLENIQMPGKKAMDVSAFLLGNRIDIGTVLG